LKNVSHLSNAGCCPPSTVIRHVLYTISLLAQKSHLETWGVQPLAYSRPLWHLCSESLAISHIPNLKSIPQSRNPFPNCQTLFPPKHGKPLTMYPLPISLHFPIEHRVFVFRQHLLLSRHLHFPPLDLLHCLSLFRERSAHCRN
jgi:hypothetical protein